MDASIIIMTLEVCAALLGGVLAVCQTSRACSTQQSACDGKIFKPLVMPQRWYLAVFMAMLGGACVHGAKEAVVNSEVFSVRLHRQGVPLANDGGTLLYRSAYYGKLQVGGPKAQIFEVVFDTGSGHLLLPSTFCRSETCMKHRRYRRTASAHSRDIDADGTTVLPGHPRDQITVTFGTGEATGVLVEDLVCVDAKAIDGSSQSTAGFSGAFSLPQGNRRTITAQSGTDQPIAEDMKENAAQRGCFGFQFIAATHLSEDPFTDFEFDGVLGLGLQGLSQGDNFNFLTMGAAQGVWGNKIFSVFLAVLDDEESEITFGGWKDGRLMPGHELAWNSIPNPELGYWALRIHGIMVNGVSLDFCDPSHGSGGCTAVVDSGTSMVALPTAPAQQLFEWLHYTSDTDSECNGPGPRLEILLDNFTIILDPADFSRHRPPHPSEDSATFDLVINTTNGSEDTSGKFDCVPLLMQLDLDAPISSLLILGEPVIQKYYTVFDASFHRIGFGEAYHEHSLPDSIEDDTQAHVV